MSDNPRIAAGDLSPVALIERMLSVTAALTDVVNEETGLLEARQPMKISDLQPRKTALANDYAMDVQSVILNHGLIDRAPAEMVVRLKKAMATLDSALRTNGRTLEASKSVSERILKSIANTVNEQKAPTLGYGRNASISQPSPGRTGAIALDARF